jgi:hypothetical protein
VFFKKQKSCSPEFPAINLTIKPTYSPQFICQGIRIFNIFNILNIGRRSYTQSETETSSSAETILCRVHAATQEAKNRSWVALIDTDEFITNNDGYYRNSNDTQNLPILRNDQTLLDHLTVIQNQGNLQRLPIVDEKCHLMPRIVFSALEDDPQIAQKASVQDGKVAKFDPMKFTTLRFHHHANPQSQNINKFGKVLVNLDKIEWEEIHRNMPNVH